MYYITDLTLVITLCRAFTNHKNEDAYKTLFQRVFALMIKATGQEIQWQHIHNQGLYGVVMDMDYAQINGRFS